MLLYNLFMAVSKLPLQTYLTMISFHIKFNLLSAAGQVLIDETFHPFYRMKDSRPEKQKAQISLITHPFILPSPPPRIWRSSRTVPDLLSQQIQRCCFYGSAHTILQDAR